MKWLKRSLFARGAVFGAKAQVQVIEAKDREHGTLFTKIATGDPTGDAIVAFVQKHSGKR